MDDMDIKKAVSESRLSILLRVVLSSRGGGLGEWPRGRLLVGLGLVLGSGSYELVTVA